MRVPGDSGTGKLNNQPASAKFLKIVSDPYSFDTDPDPVFRQNNDPDPVPIQIECFDDQKLKKHLQLKKI
jgi:hypothetical protein